ncbi:unnamed protein product [Rotaria sp. Silwood2]|nr:unnamed protein product [Rotaria sp. Silwood2]CAF4235118.1 unnamed protein product [Rotaria sp. Silwood2]
MSGLPDADLRPLVEQYTTLVQNFTFNSVAVNKSPWERIEPHFKKEPPQVRFEGVLDVLQQYADPNLSVLDVLNGGKPGRTHDALARLALVSSVVTTNFDHLIEDAALLRPLLDSTFIPFSVYYTEKQFQEARTTIDYSLQNKTSLPPLVGLWKIHGTIAAWRNGAWELMRADEDGGPVATLKVLSATHDIFDLPTSSDDLLGYKEVKTQFDRCIEDEKAVSAIPWGIKNGKHDGPIVTN